MLRICLFLMWLLPAGLGALPVPGGVPAPENGGGRPAGAPVVSEGSRARPVLDLEQLHLLELDESQPVNWKRDWWKYMLMAVLGLTCLCLLAYLTRMLLQLLAVIGCIGAGVAGAIGAADGLGAILAARLPGRLAGVVEPRLLGGAAGFLVGYLVAALLFSLLRKPAGNATKT